MSENSLQRAVATYLNDIERLYKTIVWFHAPNGMRASRNQAHIHKAYGMKAGVPDCVILADGKAFCIELKYKTSLSAAQKNFHEKLKFQNIPTYTVKAKTPMEAVNFVEAILEKHGLLERNKAGAL